MQTTAWLLRGKLSGFTHDLRDMECELYRLHTVNLNMYYYLSKQAREFQNLVENCQTKNSRTTKRFSKWLFFYLSRLDSIFLRWFRLLRPFHEVMKFNELLPDSVPKLHCSTRNGQRVRRVVVGLDAFATRARRCSLFPISENKFSEIKKINVVNIQAFSWLAWGPVISLQ